MEHTLEERVAALEAVITKTCITLTDAENPTKQIILDFSDGSFKIIKRTTNVVETSFNLTEIEID